MNKKFNRLKVIMTEKEIGVTELANKLGKHEQTIIAYRNNVKQPPLKMIYEIANALGVDPCDLLVKVY